MRATAVLRPASLQRHRRPLRLSYFGELLIVGPMTVAVLLLNLAVARIMFTRQRHAFDRVGVRVHRNLPGFLVSFLTYQLVMSPTSLGGYLQEVFGVRRRW